MFMLSRSAYCYSFVGVYSSDTFVLLGSIFLTLFISGGITLTRDSH